MKTKKYHEKSMGKIEVEEQKQEYEFSPRIYIMDDDSVVTKVLEHRIKMIYPNAFVSVSNIPLVEAGYDVYFIDNDFEGEKLACSLMQEIRQVSPHALIVALSSTLDLETLRTMVNRGCCAVYDKCSPDASADARKVIDHYLSELKEMRQSNGNRSDFKSILKSMKELLNTWNQYLDRVDGSRSLKQSS